MRSRCEGSILACTLNTTPEKAEASGCTSWVASCFWTMSELTLERGEGAMSTSASSTSMTPKLFTPEPKNTGVCCAAKKAWVSKLGEAPVASSMLSMAVSKSLPKRCCKSAVWLSGMVSKSCGRRSLPDSNTVMAWVRKFKMPPKLLPCPTGQVMGTQGMPSSRSTSSKISSGSRTSRSILLTKVMMGVLRWRHTSMRRRVWLSTPLAASITIRAESTAVSTR